MGVAEREVEIDTEQENLEQDGPLAEGLDEVSSETAKGTEGAETGEDGDEDVVQIGEEEPPASEEEKAAPKWVKDLRERQKQLARENAELKARLSTGQPAQQGKPELPAKPKLADFDYDEEKFEQARDAWDAKKREVDSWEANQRQAHEAQQKAIQAVQEDYAKSKQALKVKDFQEAESEVVAAMNEWQRGVLVKGPKNPGLVVYALGKSPAKLQELASIKDPVKFAVAVGKLETEVKVTKRTGGNKPAPETGVRSGGSTSTSKATLERLQAEADKTGDRSKVAAYLRQQRQAGK
jgi:hypothetical protein